MRIFVISPTFVLATLAALVSAAHADIIHLKNGDVIYADQAKENGNSIEYDVGDNTFSIPKSLVETVEAGARPQSAPSPVPMPSLSPEVPSSTNSELLSKIVHGQEIDRSVLAAIEARGDANETSVAYYIAARTEYDVGRFLDCRRDLETALRFNPQSPAVLNYYAAVLVRTGDSLDAISTAEHATRLAPDSPDAWVVLGYAQFSAGHTRDSIESWKKSLALRADPAVQHLLERAERENSTESNYSERETGHFVLRYEGAQTSEAFRDQLLSTLEADYKDLSQEFEAEPHASVQVVLYTNQAFFDVTHAPSWMSALNDGTIRMPVQGLDSVTPELARVLHHELTHSFINQVSVGRCPEWLNEGIAQLLEPQALGTRTAALAQLYKAESEIPLNSLERGFSSFSGSEARLAYDESLASAQYLREHYGMSDMLRLLRQIGEGQSVESSLRSVMHTDYAHLEQELRAYLTSQAGN